MEMQNQEPDLDIKQALSHYLNQKTVEGYTAMHFASYKGNFVNI